MTEISNEQILKSKIDDIFNFVKAQLQKTSETIPENKYPRSTIKDNKEWKLVDSRDWTSGFYPGCLWYAYEALGCKELKDLAEKWTAGIEKEKNNISSHDIGFMIFCSFGNGYRLTGNPKYKDVILTAAQSLIKRYNDKVGCIRSWDFGTWKYPVIIDNIMNLELLFWAAENGGADELYHIAVKHADTTLKNHLREDGSLYHLVDYNPVNGEILSRETEKNTDSKVTWTRGHAWGVYGYPMIYRFTGDRRYIEAAEIMADNFIANLSEDFIPYWMVGERMHKKDSSAAAIAASGLLELITFIEDDELKKSYKATAEKMLLSLLSGKYYAEGTEAPGILLQGMGGDNEMDTTLIYGDYYFIEALLRYKKLFCK